MLGVMAQMREMVSRLTSRFSPSLVSLTLVDLCFIYLPICFLPVFSFIFVIWIVSMYWHVRDVFIYKTII